MRGLVGALACVRGVSAPSGAGSSRYELALNILKRRYALGEIDKREFEEKKRDLLS